METKSGIKPRMPVTIREWDMEKYEGFFSQRGAVSLIYHMTGIHRAAIYKFLKTNTITLPNKELIDQAIREVEDLKRK